MELEKKCTLASDLKPVFAVFSLDNTQMCYGSLLIKISLYIASIYNINLGKHEFFHAVFWP